MANDLADLLPLQLPRWLILTAEEASSCDPKPGEVNEIETISLMKRDARWNRDCSPSPLAAVVVVVVVVEILVNTGNR